MTKLSRSQIGTLSRDLNKLDDIEKLLTKLIEIRAANGRCAGIGEVIRRTIGGNTMFSAPPDVDLGAAALDGIIALECERRAELAARLADHVDIGPDQGMRA